MNAQNLQDIRIVYEDKDLLVINKPSGIVVNRAESVKGKTIEDWMEKNFKLQVSNLKDFQRRNGIVHRLDKETSGLLIIAKNPKSFVNLQRQFKERKVEKHYLALVHKKLTSKKGEIKAPIGRLPWNRERFGVFAGGRKASTKYEALGYYSLRRSTQDTSKVSCTLVKVIPLTGRTHQIRVHLKYIGHPVISDKFYAGRKTYRKDKKWCPRLFLHAAFLKFKQPKSGEWIKIESNLPKDLKYVFLYLLFNI